ncbi:hypothetical protein [Sulfobacillus harzensis]|uniref:Uncharacterized protein n=1 Tax=Sulfobacillus harzensis TaxID=2729629 RepID=A0A7Y0L8Q5_9FIRM|nr:hypothetical protein [Sulfobacillus harzensis]NMP23964.1 hypothetical protein [Sulfobacillus harzensis]
MKRTPVVLATSLVLFGASAAASYHAAPHWAQSAAPTIRHAQRHNLFSMVNRLTRSNQALQSQAQQVLDNLQAAHQQLGGLKAVNHQLSAEVAENNAGLSAMTNAIGINRALVQSQQQIISREHQTHTENAAVEINISRLGGQVSGVENSMNNLYQVSEGLSGNMLGLSTTLTGVLSALEALQTNTSLPIVHVPVTSLLPPVFGSSGALPPKASSRETTTSPSSTTKSILSPLNSILGGL